MMFCGARLDQFYRNCLRCANELSRKGHMGGHLDIHIRQCLMEIFSEFRWSHLKDNFCEVVSLGADGRRFGNFVVTSGTVGCHYDNLRCRRWRQGCRVDGLLFSVFQRQSMPTASILYHGKQLDKLCFSALPSLQTLFWMCIFMCKCDAVWENKILDLTWLEVTVITVVPWTRMKFFVPRVNHTCTIP